MCYNAISQPDVVCVYIVEAWVLEPRKWTGFPKYIGDVFGGEVCAPFFQNTFISGQFLEIDGFKHLYCILGSHVDRV